MRVVKLVVCDSFDQSIIDSRFIGSILGIRLLTMSDHGWENNGIANIHTTVQHQLDPSLCGTLQHRWCIDKTNIKAEASWSQFRSQWAPGFEDVLDLRVNTGLYNPLDPLEKYLILVSAVLILAHCAFVYSLVFRWIAIPWLQVEINKWVWAF